MIASKPSSLHSNHVQHDITSYILYFLAHPDRPFLLAASPALASRSLQNPPRKTPGYPPGNGALQVFDPLRSCAK
jgi:hypothetical protein